MSSVFVRALWGDRHVVRREKILWELARAIENDGYLESPRVVYAFGKENADWLVAHGIECELLDEEAVPDWGTHFDRDNRGWPSSYAMWQCKVHAMLAAMRESNEILWLDWDARTAQEVPPDFWNTMRELATIQMPLVKFRRPFCYWRDKDRQYVPEGAFIYCRDVRIVEKVQGLYLDQPSVDDQELWGQVIDLMMGKWHDYPAEYRIMGFDPDFVRIYHQVHPPEDDPVFVVSRGPSHRAWVARKAASEV